MKRILLILMTALLTLISFNVNSGVTTVVADNNLVSETIEVKELDGRAKILSKYLASYNSPMQYHAQDFIDAADKYELDWKMLPAIAGVESTFGKFIPGGYNAYGWGVYGTNRIYFKSWRDGIFVVAKGLREGYLSKGLKDPYSINRVYAASPHWGKNVTFFMNDLEKYSKRGMTQQVYQFQNGKISSSNEHLFNEALKIAAISGQPILK